MFLICTVCTTECNRVCQNGGTLNSTLYTCSSCSDNYAGDVCESASWWLCLFVQYKTDTSAYVQAGEPIQAKPA